MGRHGTIAGRKAAQDAKRGALFTKYAKLITVAAKGGGDPEYNAGLKNAISKAKAINMPNDKITNAIKRGTGEIEGASYEGGSFEGYGPSGVAVIVEFLTDNKNRTVAAVKSAFDKNGGNLGTPGCVSYMFERKGVVLVEKSKATEDRLMEIGLDAGLEDLIDAGDEWEMRTAPGAFGGLAEALTAAGIEPDLADDDYLPNMEAEVKSEADLKALRKMVGLLEENEDVQKVYTNSKEPLTD